MSFSGIHYGRKALKKFVDEEIQPGDFVAILGTGGTMGIYGQFTTDKRILNSAIERIRFRPYRNNMPREVSENDVDMKNRSQEFQDDSLLRNTLSIIRYAANGLREMPGRKSIFVFSENMKILNTTNISMSTEFTMTIKQIVDDANRASAVIYTMDTRGLPTDEDLENNYTAPKWQRTRTNFGNKTFQDLWASREGLQFLAEETGGLFFHDHNDLDRDIRRMLEDQDGYYLLGYHPHAATFAQKADQVRFHSLQVRLKRPGLKVRSRRSFLGVSDQEKKSLAYSSGDPLRMALLSPFAATDVPLRVTALFFHDAAQGSFLSSIIHIDAKGLSFLDEPNASVNSSGQISPAADTPTRPVVSEKLAGEPPGSGLVGSGTSADSRAGKDSSAPTPGSGGWKKTVIDVLVTTFDDSGLPVDNSHRTFTLRMRGGRLKEAMEDGLFYRICHPVKKPGAYQLRVAVRDVTSQRIGSASQYVEVPDIDKGKLALSGILLKSWKPDLNDGMANKEGQMEESDPRRSPAIRIFSAGQTLQYDYAIINAGIDKNHKTAIESVVRLFHENKLLFTGNPMVEDCSGQTDLKHIITGGRLQLGSTMESGNYTLQLIVQDRLADKKHNKASQYINFEIQ
jgi:VWFA-related protein